LQGWHEDPFGLHEQRYFSAGHPTKLVRDGRVEAYDEPPAQEVPPDDGAVGASVPPADNGVPEAGLWVPAAPGFYLGQPSSEGGDAALTGSPATPYRVVGASRRRTGLVNAVVALVAVATVVVFVLIEGGFR